jgi:hypothetical protein
LRETRVLEGEEMTASATRADPAGSRNGSHANEHGSELCEDLEAAQYMVCVTAEGLQLRKREQRLDRLVGGIQPPHPLDVCV